MSEFDNRFANLRSVRWRVNLSVLPSHDSSSIDDLRRATAESRRRYASLRRRLLIDPHVTKDVRNSPDLSIDNPLSQNPDSTWGQFFRNAELEKTLDQDLSRLYPEHWSYFQAPGCQGMLRRILLLWCLKHPEFGYRQGMHELLAPLLYVLHVDIERLSEVRKTYEDHFTDRFDGLSFEERDITYNFDFKKFLDSTNDEINQGNFKKIKNLDELDPEIQAIVKLSDAYGAEGELGIVLSEKFMEHDAYCMFDALMNGNRGRGCVAMAGFFAYSPCNGSNTGLPPVLEACTAFYNLLSFVDSSLHSHLVELGVEPQYFGLRWLRVLFGREFLLQDLLIVWDEIFSADNTARNFDNSDHSYRIFDSPRGALIAGIAVSMILCLRSSLLATENAASCLQRLLNFPEKIDLKKILEKAKSLQGLTMESDVRAVLSVNSVFDSVSPVPARTNSFPSGSTSPKSPLIITPESYWEEKWRVLNKAEEEQRERESKSLEKQSNNGGYKKKTWFKVKRLFRVESEPTQSKIGIATAKSEGTVSSVARSLLEDFNREIETESANRETEEITDDFEGSGEEIVEESLSGVLNPISSQDSDSNFAENDLSFAENDLNLVENDPSFIENDSSFVENESDLLEQETSLDSPLPISSQPSIEHPLTRANDGEAEEESAGKSAAVVKESKVAVLPGKFQWFWKLGRNLTGENSSNKSGLDVERCTDVENGKSGAVSGSEVGVPEVSAPEKEGNGEQNVMNTLKNIGHSMLDHIQVIESVFQQEGQKSALTAIKELRKISNLLLQM